MTDLPDDRWKRSAGYLSELEKLPEEARSAFEDLVGQYRYYALANHRHPFVSYRVLGALIRAGWRPTA